VFPARYELNSYIVFRKRLVSKRLSVGRDKPNYTAHNLHIYRHVSRLSHIVVMCSEAALSPIHTFGFFLINEA
jgi:hypothetical protein